MAGRNCGEPDSDDRMPKARGTGMEAARKMSGAPPASPRAKGEARMIKAIRKMGGGRR